MGRNCFEIVIDNFNGIHTFIGIENAAHITGDRIAQSLESFHRNGLIAVVEENLICHRSFRHDGYIRLIDRSCEDFEAFVGRLVIPSSACLKAKEQ